jgi:hypothetical protein
MRLACYRKVGEASAKMPAGMEKLNLIDHRRLQLSLGSAIG